MSGPPGEGTRRARAGLIIMDSLMPVLASAVLASVATQSRPVTNSWELAMGMGALVLLAGGITAMARRAMRPGQALGVVGVALAVAGLGVAVSILSGRSVLTGGAYVFLITATTTVGGMAMAVAIVSSSPRRPH